MDLLRRKRWRLAVLAALIASAGGTASADDHKVLARQLFDLGIEEYKAKNYDAASISMAKAYQLDPQPDTLYALAQSERLANKCKDATTHYQLLLDQAKDEKTQQVVKQNLELCAQIERGEKPKETPVEVERRDAPTIQIRTVYKIEQRSNKLAIALYTIGGISLGGAATTYLLASSTRADADHATSLEAYNELFDRARLLRNISYGAAATGAVLVTWATIRVVRGNKARRVAQKAAFVPLPGGSLLAYATTW